LVWQDINPSLRDQETLGGIFICLENFEKINFSKSPKQIKIIELRLKYIIELDRDEYNRLREEFMDFKTFDSCKSVYNIAIQILRILEKDKDNIMDRDIKKTKSLLTIIIKLEEIILELEKKNNREPINSLLAFVKYRKVRISAFSNEELLSEASTYRRKEGSSYISLQYYE